MEDNNYNRGVLGEVYYDNRSTALENVNHRGKKRRRRRKNNAKWSNNSGRNLFNFGLVPTEIWMKIFSYCDNSSIECLKMTCLLFYNIIDANSNFGFVPVNNRGFANMPSEIILAVFGYLSRSDLARSARVCRRFRDLASADCLWLTEARQSLVTNNCHPEMKARSVQPWMPAQDLVRVSHSWTRGYYRETQLLIQDTRYMPRIQLESDTLWVSWGAQVWAHPRRSDGTVCRTASKVLRGHSDDVSRFVVKDGLVVSGGRDKTLVGWRQSNMEDHAYDFAFARRYCHGSEVSAVDVASGGSVVISGSRDHMVKMWRLDDTLSLVNTINIGDRIWSLATSDGGCVAVGSAGLYGVPSLNLIDLATGALQEIGAGLRKGAGMLDLAWIDSTKFLSCGYDSFARLWDTRSGICVRKWEEPFNEAIYCMSTDNNMTLVCGTARHGLVRLWDMRHTQPVQMYHVKHPRNGQSSPVYSVSFDQSNLYVALDQCLNLVSFTGQHRGDNSANHNRVVYYR